MDAWTARDAHKGKIQIDLYIIFVLVTIQRNVPIKSNYTFFFRATPLAYRSSEPCLRPTP